MKRIYDMEKEEILALTQEYIEKLIDYECALKGVPLLPPRPLEPDKVNIEPDITAYEIAGLCLLTAEEAGRILEAINTCSIYTSTYVPGANCYDKKLIPVDAYTKPKIETKRFYSMEYWDKVKSQKEAYASTKRIYDEDKKKYDEAYSKRSETASCVWEFIDAVREENRVKDYLTAEFNRYLELTDGNKTIAMRFLKKAHNVDDELTQELVPGFVEEEAKVS